MTTIFVLLKDARSVLDSDPHLANFMLRDTQEVKDAGLSDLAWALHKGHPSRDDVLGLIEALEASLKVKPLSPSLSL